ncbi:C6 transcription factor [Stemphylium lycopersici]|nr:C6 transcription factor [Stemphylium lycopersici]
MSQDSSSTSSDCIVGTAAAPSASLPILQQPEVETNLGFGNLGPGAFSYPSTSSWSDLDSLLGGSSGLGWNDLFFDPTAGFSLPVPEDTSTEPHGTLGPTGGPSPYQDIEMEWYDMIASRAASNGGDLEAVAEVPSSLSTSSSATEMSDNEVLEDAKFLLKIIGESTFVLHDDTNSGLEAKVEDFIKYRCNTKVTPSSSENATKATGTLSQLDDFLRIVAPCAESDSDVDLAKDQEAGIHDIHLSDPRPWPKTLYMDIYGIPEIWLSLVSQTTRVANIVDLLERKPLEVPRPFAKSLQRKQNRLEDMVCTFSSELSDTHPLPQEVSDPPGSASSMALLAGRAMLRAMGSALVIFFYRRVRKVHPFILQTHVDDIVTALQAFDATQSSADVKTPGTPWPAFMAGCEAMSHSSREWLLDWMRKGERCSASNGFTSSQQVMREVWQRRDAADLNAQNQKAGASFQAKGNVYSWVDVLRESNIWLMLF